MCHAHPRYHPCNHTSMSWFFCTTASCDLKEGTSEPCSESRLALDQSVKMDCPVKSCKFKQKGPGWYCCECGQGPNTKGWCTMPRRGSRWDSSGHNEVYITTCDHGCCEDCRSMSPPSASQSRPGGKDRSRGSSTSSISNTSPKKSYSRKRNTAEQNYREYGDDASDQYVTSDLPVVEYEYPSEPAKSSWSSKESKNSHYGQTY